jgi:hypothetical protein
MFDQVSAIYSGAIDSGTVVDESQHVLLIVYHVYVQKLQSNSKTHSQCENRQASPFYTFLFRFSISSIFTCK